MTPLPCCPPLSAPVNAPSPAEPSPSAVPSPEGIPPAIGDPLPEPTLPIREPGGMRPPQAARRAGRSLH